MREKKKFSLVGVNFKKKRVGGDINKILYLVHGKGGGKRYKEDGSGVEQTLRLLKKCIRSSKNT